MFCKAAKLSVYANLQNDNGYSVKLWDV